jgi:hypothetical protein
MSGFEFDTPAAPGLNQHAKLSNCRTCGGDRFVMVRLRSADQSVWMEDHGFKPNGFHEEYAPCPDCNATTIEYWHHDGTRFRSMDAAAAREALRA